MTSFSTFSEMAWVFLRDDEVDCGSLAEDQPNLDANHDDSIAFIRHSLHPEINTDLPSPGRMNYESSAEINRAMQLAQSKADRDYYMDALVSFINAVRVSQTQWQGGVTPVEDFVKRHVMTIEFIPNLYP
ncbi:hypothetical protein BDU57DRAFT_118909 [Ampelomyces quisqualis]|uniref:Uncharacterized protein n=1 Tax=Ampelomyces quisqualis TaxID=50730 RepID=A0A6A5QXZ5_AMPQU|nr:hypothetical protein BDU57DRAFT_118909 [Ampelomyces quisqualis]